MRFLGALWLAFLVFSGLEKSCVYGIRKKSKVRECSVAAASYFCQVSIVGVGGCSFGIVGGFFLAPPFIFWGLTSAHAREMATTLITTKFSV